MLGVVTDAGLVLPRGELPARIRQAQIKSVQSGLGQVCGLPFNVLRCLAFSSNMQAQRTDTLYLLEMRTDEPSSSVLPPGFGWIALKDLPGTVVPEVLMGGFSAWLAEWKSGPAQRLTWQPPPLSSPWARPGWYARAETWIAAEMTNLGKTVRAIEPLKSWSISAVLRLITSDRPVFFKACLDLPLFVNEGEVMAGLAQLYPDHIPAPLAVNAAQNWMLLEDLGEPLGHEAPIDQKDSLFRVMARIQIDSSRRIDDLLRIGCIDRRIPWLQARLEPLLADEVTLSLLTETEKATLRQALPRLQMLLAELDSLPIPPALLHGDLHTGNVALRDGEIQIFDWSDAAVTHPFFDLDVIFTDEEPGQREKLGDAYLSAWEGIYPAGKVRRAFELAQVVYGLYHAVSYQYILNNLEAADRPEIHAAHYFLRMVLAGLAHVNLP